MPVVRATQFVLQRLLRSTTHLQALSDLGVEYGTTVVVFKPEPKATKRTKKNAKLNEHHRTAIIGGGNLHDHEMQVADGGHQVDHSWLTEEFKFEDDDEKYCYVLPRNWSTHGVLDGFMTALDHVLGQIDLTSKNSGRAFRDLVDAHIGKGPVTLYFDLSNTFIGSKEAGAFIINEKGHICQTMLETLVRLAVNGKDNKPKVHASVSYVWPYQRKAWEAVAKRLGWIMYFERRLPGDKERRVDANLVKAMMKDVESPRGIKVLFSGDGNRNNGEPNFVSCTDAFLAHGHKVQVFSLFRNCHPNYQMNSHRNFSLRYVDVFLRWLEPTTERHGPTHFCEILSPGQAKDLFRQSVKQKGFSRLLPTFDTDTVETETTVFVPPPPPTEYEVSSYLATMDRLEVYRGRNRLAEYLQFRLNHVSEEAGADERKRKVLQYIIDEKLEWVDEFLYDISRKTICLEALPAGVWEGGQLVEGLFPSLHFDFTSSLRQMGWGDQLTRSVVYCDATESHLPDGLHCFPGTLTLLSIEDRDDLFEGFGTDTDIHFDVAGHSYATRFTNDRSIPQGGLLEYAAQVEISRIEEEYGAYFDELLAEQEGAI